MRTTEANKAFSRRTDNNVLNVCVTAVLCSVAGAVILCPGFEVVQEIGLRLEPGLLSLPMKCGWYLSAIGALVGCGGFVGCHVLEGRSHMPRWPVYLYGSAFVISGFALLLKGFGVSGASYWQW